MHVAPFSIRIEEEVLSDLRERIRKTRWPDPAPGSAWEQGTDLEYLRSLLAYWADGFDWRAQERELNAAHQFRADLGGAPFLTDPDAHGIDGPAFDVVIPSLPGYAFSERPNRVGVNYQHVAGLWHRLMQ